MNLCNLWSTLIVYMLDVARRAVRLAARCAVTGSAGGSGSNAIDRRIKGLVTTRTRQTPFFVSSDPGDDRYALIVKGVKLITPPLLI